MAVEFHLPSAQGLGVISFGWSPLFEAALSLRCVAHPKRYPMHLPWARRCRELPEDLQAEIRVLTSGYDRFLPGVFEVGLAGDHAGFAEELAAMAAIDDDLMSWELSLGLGGVSCSAMPEQPSLDDPAYRAQVVSRAESRSDAHGDVARLVFDDPGAIRDRVVRMMERYWEEAFAREWDRQWPRIEAEVSAGARTLVMDGTAGLVADFIPEASWDPDEHVISIERPWNGVCDVADRGGMLLVPTVYGWPKVMIELSEPWPVSMIVPLRELRQPEVPQASDHEVADGLRALGDETRLQITRMVAEQPRSTKELATLLQLSDSAVSRHLKILSGAGIVEGERDGYFVLYQLQPDRIGQLGGALRRTLGLARTTAGPTPALPVTVPRRNDPVEADASR
ncbi:MAG TPA: DUF5937 family protein [Nitriliruptoraceae bacterium]|nr:DUF5937 family protein [Nitriliruptoraceae bacterium]